jgi:hypothetical protein
MITRRPAVWLLTVLLLAGPVFSQKKKEPTGPRAVAVLEWTSQGVRLVPISLLIDGRYYDATLYRANPIPMALDQDTVYEVQKAGTPIGDFTVTLAGQLPNGSWVGQGNYESDEDRRKKAEDRAKSKPVLEKQVDPKDERPILRHGSPKSETPAPPPEAAPSATSGGAQMNAAPPPPPTPELTQTDNDPNRPILKRGKPAEEQAENLGKDNLPHKVPAKPPAGLNKMQVAVSDASTNEVHPYVWKWSNPEEEKTFHEGAERLALSLVTDYAKKTGGPSPGKLEITGFHAFDLAYNNEPQVILTARMTPAVPPPVRKTAAKSTSAPVPSGFEYYVTLVATQDIYNQMQKMFSSVTDNKHLDAFPRFELVDAVDADGDLNGDLLFRRISDRSTAFVLYKVIGTRVEELLSVPEPRETNVASKTAE